MLKSLAPYNKALAAAVGGAISAAVPAVFEALEGWVVGVIALVITGGITLASPKNAPKSPAVDR